MYLLELEKKVSAVSVELLQEFVVESGQIKWLTIKKHHHFPQLYSVSANVWETSRESSHETIQLALIHLVLYLNEHSFIDLSQLESWLSKRVAKNNSSEWGWDSLNEQDQSQPST